MLRSFGLTSRMNCGSSIVLAPPPKIRSEGTLAISPEAWPLSPRDPRFDALSSS